MSRGHSDSIHSFPTAYVELITTVWGGTVVRVPYPDLRAARAARCRFYDFKKLLRKQSEEHLMQLCDQAEGVQVLMEGTELVYMLRDETTESITIALALKNARAVPNHTTEEIDAEIDRLTAFNAAFIPSPITPPTQDDLLSTYLTEPQKTIDSGSTSE